MPACLLTTIVFYVGISAVKLIVSIWMNRSMPSVCTSPDCPNLRLLHQRVILDFLSGYPVERSPATRLKWIDLSQITPWGLTMPVYPRSLGILPLRLRAEERGFYMGVLNYNVPPRCAMEIRGIRFDLIDSRIDFCNGRENVPRGYRIYHIQPLHCPMPQHPAKS